MIELGLRGDAAPLQLGDAIEVGLGLVSLRLQRGDARVQRLHLQRQLLVGDLGDDRASDDIVALLDRQRGDRSADPRARDFLNAAAQSMYLLGSDEVPV